MSLFDLHAELKKDNNEITITKRINCLTAFNLGRNESLVKGIENI
jgi:hypothetical protein